MRKSETEADKILWNALCARGCGKLKFRRQHPEKEFILDFYCHEYLLGIEVDGSVHYTDDAKEYDLNRTTELEDMGISILRFRNEEVLNNMTEILQEIRSTVIRIQNTAIQ